MRSFLQTLAFFLGLFSFIRPSAFAQISGDWIWYNNAAVAPKFIYDLKQGPDNALWMASETKIVRFDGNNWTSYDYRDAGIDIQVTNYIGNLIRSFAFGPDGKIWCSPYGKVLEFDPLANTWVVHDPANSQANVGGIDLAVLSDGTVWWLTGSSIYWYENNNWTRHYFYFPTLDIDNSCNGIFIENDKSIWLTTSSSICFDSPCFTPSGVIHYNGTDTIAYDGETLGFPSTSHICITRGKSGGPLLAVNNGKPYLLAYENGSWQSPIEVPYNFFAYDISRNQQGEIWLAGIESQQPIAVRRKADGSWQKFGIDPQQINKITSFFVDSIGNFWIAGYRSEYVNGTYTYKAALGLLPASNLKAQGRVFADLNNNNSADVGEPGFVHNIVEIYPGPSYVMTNISGDYTASLPAEGNYTAQADILPYCTQTLPLTGGQNFSVTSAVPSAQALDFGMFPQQDAIDVSATFTALNPARPGFIVCYRIDYKNNAPKTANGTITCAFDNLLTFQNASQTPISNINNTLVFSFSDLKWMETGFIEVCFMVPANAVLGNSIRHSGKIYPDAGKDLNLTDNAFESGQVIIGAYDPNIKEVAAKGMGDAGEIDSNVPFLEYTIRFQNTGTDTAFTVILTDSLSTLFEIKTFEMLAASHDYRLDLYNNRVLRWTFSNIELPDSNTNELRSHGFVKFRISLKNNLPLGTVIRNNADIYFDYNQPVRTNTVANTISDLSHIVQPQSQPDCGWTVVQTEDYLNITGFKAELPAEAMLVDVYGKVVRVVHQISETFWIGDLPAGIYFVGLRDTNLCRQVRKITRF